MVKEEEKEKNKRGKAMGMIEMSGMRVLNLAFPAGGGGLAVDGGREVQRGGCGWSGGGIIEMVITRKVRATHLPRSVHNGGLRCVVVPLPCSSCESASTAAETPPRPGTRGAAAVITAAMPVALCVNSRRSSACHSFYGMFISFFFLA